MQWSIGDHGFEMTLSPQVPSLIREHLPGWLARWLAKHDLAVPDVERWAPHPGGPRILDAIGAALDLEPAHLQPARDVLAERGNMSSPTVLFVLDRLRTAPGPCVCMGFGPGLTMEGALLVEA